MFESFTGFHRNWALTCQCSLLFQVLMATSDHNLIDFSAESPRTETTAEILPTINIPIITASNENRPIAENLPPVLSVANASKTGKTNKSLFEITRVESHGESVGGDDSELDDTYSETHDSSSTSVLESIAKFLPDTEKSADGNLPPAKPQTLPIDNPATSGSLAVSTTQSLPASNALTTQTEAPSRFRIVKIAKSKPYDKGKWFINDFSDSQKQTEASDSPASPMVKRNRHQTESGGENRNRSITSPTEPVKTKSSDFFAHHHVSTQSRGSSYNSNAVDRRSSLESTNTSDASSTQPIVTPMVEALTSALDQIQSIKDSMVLAVNDEVRKLKDSLLALQNENNYLREENEQLKKKLNATEERLKMLDKG